MSRIFVKAKEHGTGRRLLISPGAVTAIAAGVPGASEHGTKVYISGSAHPLRISDDFDVFAKRVAVGPPREKFEVSGDNEITIIAAAAMGDN